MMNLVPNALTLSKVAMNRYDDADCLMKAKRYNAAIYLAGYAVECMLKSLLVTRTPVSKTAEIQDFFRGNLGHNLEQLLLAIRERGENFPSPVTRMFQTINKIWSVNIRYQHVQLKHKEAASIMNAVLEIITLIKGRI
jgi:HEPN domain-containing protein